VLDLDHGGMLGTLRKLPQLRASAALAAASLMVLSTGLLWQSRPEAQPAPVPRESLALFPMQLGGWRGQTAYLDPQTLEVLGADDHLNASFVKGAHRVELTLTYYHALNGGNGGIHSPEVCLPAGGWEVSEWSRTPVPVAGEVEPGLIVNRAVIQKGSYRQLVYYWFEQRGTRTASDYAAKFLSLRDTVATGRSDGGLVRLVTPIGHTEGLASAEARLAAIMQQIVPMLPRYFPPA
jgi:EpsI family protein